MVDEILDFEKGLFEFVDTQYPEIFSQIRELTCTGNAFFPPFYISHGCQDISPLSFLNSALLEETDIYALGKKGLDSLSRKGYHIVEDYSEVMNEPLYADAIHIGKNVLASIFHAHFHSADP